MLRAQWSFGTIGPVSDLTLEGFYSVDNEVAQPGLPTSSTNYWGSIQGGTTPVMMGRTPCGGDFMAKRGIPRYMEDPLLPYNGTGPGPNRGGGCSQRGDLPHSNLADGRGGGRILGTIHDFTFSIAHYYTYQDFTMVRTNIISPTRDHLRWDLGLPTDSQGRPWADNVVNSGVGQGNTANPWGVEDPFAARMISSGANANGRGAFGTIGGVERDLRSTVNYPRIQVTGASLSFPVNALTGMFVGSDNPLYYIYTTFRSEIAFFNNVGINKAYRNLDGATAINRFLGADVLAANYQPTAVFGPGGVFADQVGRRTAHLDRRDVLAWNIGLDHNQWIRWLNRSNSFVFSAQQFWLNINGQPTTYKSGSLPSILNDKNVLAGVKRQFQRANPRAGANPTTCDPGSNSRAGCVLWGFGGQSQLTTLLINTQYMAGNLRPSVLGFYDWSGSWFIQPGIDWTFWDPFRAGVRYNYLDGKGNSGIGIQNRKDSVWIELQYLLY
jgi:hypothetical protein